MVKVNCRNVIIYIPYKQREDFNLSISDALDIKGGPNISMPRRQHVL